MSRIGVGVIGASPLRPGWAVTAHLPALLALSEYELRAVATSSEASAKAAGEAYGVPAYADPAAMIARADIDLVVVTVKLAHHHTLVAELLPRARWSCANGRLAWISNRRRILPNRSRWQVLAI
jgi:predicted dehydrogenase